MDASLIFDLLGFPVAPWGDGDLVVVGDHERVRRVPLRETPWHVLDTARDQSPDRRWLLTRGDLFLAPSRGVGEIGFSLAALGAVPTSAGFVPSLLEATLGSTSTDERRLFVANAIAGAFLFEVNGDKLRRLNDEAIDFVATACVTQPDGVTFVGASRRSMGSDGSHQPGRPAIVRVDVDARAMRARVPLLLAPVADQVTARLMAMPHGLERHVAAQAVPEVIVAAAGEGFLIGLTALPDRLDPVDELAPRIMNAEVIGLTWVSGQGEVGAVALHTSCLGTWQENGGPARAVTIARGRDHGRMRDLSILELNQGATTLSASEMSIDGGGIPSIGELLCHRFQPCWHPMVGSFAVARIGEPNRTERPAVLVQRDSARWTVVSDESTKPTMLAPGV